MSPHALFVWGGWPGHEPEHAVRSVAPLLEQAGFTVTIRDTLAAFDDAHSLRRYAVIIPCWTMGELTGPREHALCHAVHHGAGLAGWHGGMGDAFRAATDYQFMVGGQFVAHPGNTIHYRVQILDQTHPITRGLHDFTLTSEQYYMHVDPSNRVLAATTFTGEHCPWVDGCQMPVAWTRHHGRGRVFYCSLGHVAADLAIPPVRELIRRGILWAAHTLEDES